MTTAVKSTEDDVVDAAGLDEITAQIQDELDGELVHQLRAEADPRQLDPSLPVPVPEPIVPVRPRGDRRARLTIAALLCANAALLGVAYTGDGFLYLPAPLLPIALAALVAAAGAFVASALLAGGSPGGLDANDDERLRRIEALLGKRPLANAHRASGDEGIGDGRVEAILEHVEKISVFFESLFDKHIFRLNQELREKDERIAALSAAAGGAGEAPTPPAPARTGARYATPPEGPDELRARIRDLEERQTTTSGTSTSESAAGADDPAVAGSPLLARLTELERLARGEVSPEPSRTQVREVIQRARASLIDCARQCGVRVNLQQAKSLAPVMVDPALLEAALRELLANAIGYTRSGGTVRVAAEIEKTGGNKGGRFLAVSVKDPGARISKTASDALFEPFGQERERPNDTASGLELPLARRYARLLGGRVEFAPRGGSGCTVVLRLPLA